METEVINIRGVKLAHSIVSINKDGACIFGAISYIFMIAKYLQQKFTYGTYDSFCELVAATQLYPIFKHGNNDNPVKRLKFSGNLSGGHFNVYIPCESQMVSRKLHRDAVEKHQENNSEAHREAVAATAIIYQAQNPEQHRASIAIYQSQNLGNTEQLRQPLKRDTLKLIEQQIYQTQYREQRSLPWRIKVNSTMVYNPDIYYENGQTIDIGKMTNKCKNWKVQLEALGNQPDLLHNLLMDNYPEHKHFMNNIRKYNGCFQITSFGAGHIFQDFFMPKFKVQGQVYHLVGSLLPLHEDPQFLQIYFVGENEREDQI
ncbi:hypothetical protein CVS40_8589 [Lucilia cuprina]|nr:hypothetical protein CVS40_8589 [Lucilia cuprina]